jgi:hypothetical protein
VLQNNFVIYVVHEDAFMIRWKTFKSVQSDNFAYTSKGRDNGAVLLDMGFIFMFTILVPHTSTDNTCTFREFCTELLFHLASVCSILVHVHA